MLGETLMQDPNRLREQARRCRSLAKTGLSPKSSSNYVCGP
jgi:hypothetical protein